MNEFTEEERQDVVFPPFVVCPTYSQGVKANISAIKCVLSISGAVRT